MPVIFKAAALLLLLKVSEPEIAIFISPLFGKQADDILLGQKTGR
jgi:hypothetical protein